EKGSTLFKIEKLLKEKRVLKPLNLFRFWVSYFNAEKKLKPGLYSFKEGSPSYYVVKKILKGDSIKVKVTIPEGFRKEQIALRLESKGLVDSKKFLKIVEERKLEGKLFPDTYFFTPGMKEEEIVDILYNSFRRFYDTNIKEKAKEIGMNEDDVVILASIIEKEAKTKEEKFLISGIFHNRFKKRWRLESCATVRYALKKWEGKLTFKDLKVRSPYNTYRIFGLPPSPICNPGRDSLVASVNPVKTDLFFFVADGKGTHRFSRYFKDHVRKKFERKRRAR
ncbi:MAG: endolytic transglycosylase MltG, partial [Caldiserica bacterium]